MYIQNSPNQVVIICLYVVNMLIMTNDIANINATKRKLTSKFDIKNLGVADLFLRIKIYNSSRTNIVLISLHQNDT